MKYLSSNEIANLWNVSERTVRDYCKNNKVDGAKLVGKSWKIPSDAKKPIKKITPKFNLIETLKYERTLKVKGGIYHRIQVDMAYNSNHIEGSKLSKDETMYIFDTNSIGLINDPIKVNDIIETMNHFICVNYIIDNVNAKLTQKYIKHLHFLLKSSTVTCLNGVYEIGEYKTLPNEVGGKDTCPPEKVEQEMEELLTRYNSIKKKTLKDIVNFHVEFERIHPFFDGNGRVGRLIMFKECLKNKIIPFIIYDDMKLFYYRGLKEWNFDRSYLLDTCLTCQDKFIDYLNYFKIG